MPDTLLAVLLLAGSAALFGDVVRVAGPALLELLGKIGADPVAAAAIRDLPLPLLAALVLLLAAYRLGRWCGGRTRDESFGIGALVLSLLPILWSLVRPLNDPGLLFALLLPALWQSWRRAAALPAEARGFLLPADPFDRFLRRFGAASLAWAFLFSLVPPSGMDALVYHLGLGAQYLARGHLAPPDATVYYQYTQAGEMLAMLGIAADRAGTASNILLGLSLPLFAFAVARAAGAWTADRSLAESERARSIAFAVAAAFPLGVILVAHTKPDLLALALFTLACAALAPASPSPLRAAAFAGGAVAVKLSAAYAAAPLVIWLMLRARRSPSRLLLVPLLALLPSAPWLLSNLAQTGHLLPQTAHIAPALAGSLGAAFLARTARIFAATFLVITEGIDGPFGAPLAAVALAALAPLARRDHPLRPLSVVGFAAILLWFTSGGGSHAYAASGLFRFALPAFGALLPAGAAVLAARTLDGGPPAKALRLSLTVSLAFSLATTVLVPFSVQPAPLRLVGLVSEDQYMARWLTSHETMKRADVVLPPDAKILTIGEARLFPLHRDAVFDVDADLPRALRAVHEAGHDTQVFARWVLSQGVSHILYTPDWYATKIAIGLAPAPPCPADRRALEDYLDRFTTPVVEDEARRVYLYRID